MLILFALPFVASHSWLHCIDYRGSLKEFENDKCSAWPRLMKPQAFGVDQGMNYRPSNDVLCKSSIAEPQLFRPQQKIQLTWPAKNHKADSCTNPYIPKGTLAVYQHKVSQWNDPDRLWKDALQDKVASLEFQNCPFFCENMDKAICSGSLTLPKDEGKYKMAWIWEFNTGEWYTHCFDVEIKGSLSPSDTTTLQPTSPRPSETKPVLQPTTSRPLQPNCVALWKDCTRSPCCNNLVCERKNQYYSQCVPQPQSNRFQCESCRLIN